MMYLATEQAVRDALYEADKLIEAYRIELGALRQQRDAALDVVVDLGGEVRLPEIEEAKQRRKDAERYRWLRDRCPWTMCSAHAVTRLALRLPIGYECHAEDKHDMDAAIDAVMAKETP